MQLQKREKLQLSSSFSCYKSMCAILHVLNKQSGAPVTRHFSTNEKARLCFKTSVIKNFTTADEVGEN